MLVEFRQLFLAVELGQEQLFSERHEDGHGVDGNDEAVEQRPKVRVVVLRNRYHPDAPST